MVLNLVLAIIGKLAEMISKELGIMWWFLAIALAIALGNFDAGPALASAQNDCFSQDNARRISGCSEIIDDPSTAARLRSRAYAMRALAYAMTGDYIRSIPDYDAALQINPDFAVAWNNRAWSLFKSGQPLRALPNVERSLGLSPFSAHSYDTRAHIRQVTGHPQKALKDYKMAIRLGGRRLTRLYQCGLQERGLYQGLLDGIDRPSLQSALKTCVASKTCDPLPDDENCRQATS